VTTQLYIPQTTTGLVLADLNVRLYSLAGVRQTGAEGALALAPATAGGHYYLTGVPPSCWVIWEYPAGVGYGERVGTAAGAPPVVVLPFREAGLLLADLGPPALLKDGAEQGDALALAEIGGADPGDYALSGWPVDEAGSWSVIWTRDGEIAGAWSWQGMAAAAGGADTSFEGRDAEDLAAFMDGFTPTGLGSGYLRIFSPAEDAGKPQPTTDPDNPRIFGTWAADYTRDHDPVMEAASPPTRYGRLIVVALMEQSPRAGFIIGEDGLFSQLRAAAAVRDVVDGFQFLPQAGNGEGPDVQPPWAVYSLQIPFISTG
jgi:hypothetical protein